MIDKILNMIRKPKGTAAEYREALGAIDLKAAAAAVEILEGHRRDLLLTGSEQQIEEIETKLRQGNREVDRLHAASDQLKRLITEAEAAEAVAAVEARAANACEVHANLVQAYVAVHNNAMQLTAALSQAHDLKRELRMNNEFFKSQGRPDLMMATPIEMLSKRITATRDAAVEGAKEAILADRRNGGIFKRTFG